MQGVGVINGMMGCRSLGMEAMRRLCKEVVVRSGQYGAETIMKCESDFKKKSECIRDELFDMHNRSDADGHKQK